jgi:undecaprenyl diphosphate synthase
MAVPVHIAVTMDGNGRWARSRGLGRTEGHKAAETSIREAVEWCGEKGVRFLTLFAFSTENWTRPRAEVAVIMSLLSSFIRRNLPELQRQRVRVRAAGRIEALPRRALADLRRAMEETAGNDGLTLVLALNYGGRSEILDAVRSIAADAASGRVAPESIDESLFASRLYLPDVPDPDLMIRTSGEQRISNFLLWQSAYSELWFPEVLWPDFRKKHLDEALAVFESRSRRFGGLG